jgi:hypothetical protein
MKRNEQADVRIYETSGDRDRVSKGADFPDSVPDLRMGYKQRK